MVASLYFAGNGQTYVFTDTVAASTNAPYNVRTKAIAAGWDGAMTLTWTVTIASGQTLGSTGGPAFSTGTIPNASTGSLVVTGHILGFGGTGGTGGDGNGNPATGGGNGGDAVTILNGTCAITGAGDIKSGGGGGGGGLGVFVAGGVDGKGNPLPDNHSGGGGGGGGGGAVVGVGGAAGTPSDVTPATAGANGTSSAGGAGGSGGVGINSTGTNGGAGGAPGVNGSSSSTAGGVCGYAVRKNGNTVTISGPTTAGTVG